MRIEYGKVQLLYSEPCLPITEKPTNSPSWWRPNFFAEMEEWCEEHLQPGWDIIHPLGRIEGRIDSTNTGAWKNTTWMRVFIGIKFETEEDKMLFYLRWSDLLPSTTQNIRCP